MPQNCCPNLQGTGTATEYQPCACLDRDTSVTVVAGIVCDTQLMVPCLQLEAGTGSINEVDGHLEICIQDSGQLLQALESKLAFRPDLCPQIMAEISTLLADHRHLRVACEPMLPLNEVRRPSFPFHFLVLKTILCAQDLSTGLGRGGACTVM